MVINIEDLYEGMEFEAGRGSFYTILSFEQKTIKAKSGNIYNGYDKSTIASYINDGIWRLTQPLIKKYELW